MSDETTEENALKTLAALEERVQASGLFDGIGPVEYSNDGLNWARIWDTAEPPKFGQVKVWRKGIDRPYEQPMRFVDAIPDDPDWNLLWLNRPMPLFGAAIKRDHLRHMFRDIVGDYRGPDERAVDEAPEAEPDIDWDAAIEKAPDGPSLERVWADMRNARARTGAREVAYKARHAQFVRAAWATSGAPDLSSEEAIRSRAFFPETSAGAPAPFAPVPARRVDSGASAGRPDVRVPQDYKHPLNRAARRAGKKGRR